MPKKTNTRRADGRIVVQVYVGSVDGKRKYKSVYGKTQKEADQKAAELRAQLHRGVDLISENRTFCFLGKPLFNFKEKHRICRLVYGHRTEARSLRATFRCG